MNKHDFKVGDLVRHGFLVDNIKEDHEMNIGIVLNIDDTKVKVKWIEKDYIFTYYAQFMALVCRGS